MALKWYAIQTYAGSEMAVKRAIESMATDLGLEEQIGEILVPTEDIIEIKKPKRDYKIKKSLSWILFRKFGSGYRFVA